VSIDLHQWQLRSAELCVDIATTEAATLPWRFRRNATRSHFTTRSASAMFNPTGEKKPRDVRGFLLLQ